MVKNSGAGLASIIAGYVSLAFLALTVLLLLAMWSVLGFVFSWTYFVFLIVFAYVPYKTLRKKEKLSKLEWALLVIVTVVWAVVMIAVFVAGFVIALIGAASA
jgi:hypothetical protein